MVTTLQEFHGFVATETQGKVRNSNFAEWSRATRKALTWVGLELFKTDLSEPCKKKKNTRFWLQCLHLLVLSKQWRVVLVPTVSTEATGKGHTVIYKSPLNSVWQPGKAKPFEWNFWAVWMWQFQLLFQGLPPRAVGQRSTGTGRTYT